MQALARPVKGREPELEHEIRNKHETRMQVIPNFRSFVSPILRLFGISKFVFGVCPPPARMGQTLILFKGVGWHAPPRRVKLRVPPGSRPPSNFAALLWRSHHVHLENSPCCSCCSVGPSSPLGPGRGADRGCGPGPHRKARREGRLWPRQNGRRRGSQSAGDHQRRHPAC